MAATRGRSGGHVSGAQALTKEASLTIAAEEYRRLVALLRDLEASEWDDRIADCPAWNVRELAAHLIANAEAIASPIENVRQLTAAKKRVKETGDAFIDALGEVGVAPRRHLSPTELTDHLERAGERSVKARRRLPGLIRSIKLDIPPPIGEKVPLAYMMDTIYVRDTWMHRVDLCRATRREVELTPGHDGVFVADVAAEWGGRHGQPCTLTLDGPTGGTFELNGGGEPYDLDAVEFCRIVSGRAPGHGLLETQVPF